MSYWQGHATHKLLKLRQLHPKWNWPSVICWPSELDLTVENKHKGLRHSPVGELDEDGCEECVLEDGDDDAGHQPVKKKGEYKSVMWL